MGKTIINGIEYSGSGASNASQLPYDNTMNTKEKIEELTNKVNSNEIDIDNLEKILNGGSIPTNGVNKFAIAETTTLTGAGTWSIDYPEGFNFDNCVIVGVMVKNVADAWQYDDGHLGNRTYSLRLDCIKGYQNENYNYPNCPCRIILMRTDVEYVPVNNSGLSAGMNLTQLWNGDIVLNQDIISVDLTDYDGIYIESTHNAYTYSLFVPKDALTNEIKNYWAAGFRQNDTSNCNMSFGISLTAVRSGYFMYNNVLQDVAPNVTIYGVNGGSGNILDSQDFEYTKLVSVGNTSWGSTVSLEHNISDFDTLLFCVENNTGIMMGVEQLPVEMFKTLNSSTKYYSTRIHIGNTEFVTTACWYMGEKQLAISNDSNYLFTVYGIKNSNIIIGGSDLPVGAGSNLELLWENENPSSTFSAQTITLSSDNYDYLMVEWKRLNTETFSQPFVMIPKSGQIVLDTSRFSPSSQNNTYATRHIQRLANYNSVTEYVFNDGVDIQDTTKITRNDMAIPLKIYGGKFNNSIGLVGGTTKPTLLWENKDINADTGKYNAFLGQTISLDLADYDEIIICHTMYNLEYAKCDRVIKDPNKKFVLDNSYTGATEGHWVANARRFYTVSDTGVTFEHCMHGRNGSAEVSQNYYLIPYKIYGIKYDTSNSEANVDGYHEVSTGVAYAKCGNVVTVTCHNETLSLATWTLLWTLPEEYRPYRAFEFPGFTSADGKVLVDVTINPDGSIMALNANNPSVLGVAFTISYIVK